MDYMNFGKLRKAYDLGRHAYPPEVMDHIFVLIGTLSNVLDVGCGTGIATRQLAQQMRDVSGCDIDKAMIETAEEHEGSIKYYIAPTASMPFENEKFDALTVFGAFHWFCDATSVLEITRILKNGGFFIVVNKNEAGNFRNDYEQIVERLTGTKPPKSVKADYHPASILAQYGFSGITERQFFHVEEFTIPRAMTQIQSMSLWNLIPENKRQSALEMFRNHFEKYAKEGLIRRPLEIAVVSGKK